MLGLRVQPAAEALGIPQLFIGTILLPIVGNAAEHAAAIIFAMRGKMEISLGIAVGSAVQIALFVVRHAFFRSRRYTPPARMSDVGCALIPGNVCCGQTKCTLCVQSTDFYNMFYNMFRLQIPFCTLVGWIMGQPLSLDYHMFETATLLASVLLLAALVQDGKANWLKVRSCFIYNAHHCFKLFICFLHMLCLNIQVALALCSSLVHALSSPAHNLPVSTTGGAAHNGIFYDRRSLLGAPGPSRPPSVKQQ